jgi:DNA polymerase-1
LNKLVLVDGNSIFNRAFYGAHALYDRNPKFPAAIYIFFNMVLNICSKERVNCLTVAFDLPAITFRKKLFNEYKANRTPAPPDLYTQLNLLKSLLNDIHINYCEKEGFEADDIIGTIAKTFENVNCDIIIFSADRDLLQLIDTNIKMCVPMTVGKKRYIDTYDKKKIFETFGVDPISLIDIKALMGDKSDNIPGLKGIGKKNALRIVQKYGSINNALNVLHNKNGLTRCERILCEHKVDALFYKQLVTIDTNVKLDNMDLSNMQIIKADIKNFIETLKEKI